MLKFYIFDESSWMGPSSFVIQNEDEVDLLSIESDPNKYDSWLPWDSTEDDFIIRDLQNRNKRVATIRETSDSGSFWENDGSYSYDICAPTTTTTNSSSSRRQRQNPEIWATVSREWECSWSCCSNLFELEIFDKDKTRTYNLDDLSFFSSEYSLSRNGTTIATYTRPWSPWCHNQVDINNDNLLLHHGEDDDDDENNEKRIAIILSAYVLVERILYRERQRNQRNQQLHSHTVPTT